jgi:phosphoribosylaminoimidazole-succinocarboxamide synthase
VEPVTRTEIPGVPAPRRGKVRDIYDLGDKLLIVATDRVSAFDVVLPEGIPDKGKILTKISLFWFRQMEDIVENHLISADPKDFPLPYGAHKELLADRSVLVKKTTVLPIECIVRGYLSGSGWKSYRENGCVCGLELPPGLKESSKLPEPIFTPSTKAEAGHDINISFSECERLIGTESAQSLEGLSLAVYKKASAIAEEKGIIIADTKMEFGMLPGGKIILIDELLTPDSSRFWARATYKEGVSQDSYDKQIIRDYLLTLDWDQRPPAPHLPPDIMEKAARRYREIYEILTS